MIDVKIGDLVVDDGLNMRHPKICGIVVDVYEIKEINVEIFVDVLVCSSEPRFDTWRIEWITEKFK